MANKTIFDFINEAAIKPNDELPFWKILPDGSGTSSRVSFSEFIASLPQTQAGAPTEVTASTESTPLNLKDRQFYIVTLGSSTEITSVKDSAGKSFTPNSTIDIIFISAEKRNVKFTSEFNLLNNVPVEGKVGVRFKAISETELVAVGVGVGGSSAKLRDSITVAGTTWGGWKSGDVLPAGLDYNDIFLRGLRVAYPPTYKAPTASLAVTGSLYNIEAGSSLDLFSTATYTKNDGGDPTGAYFYKNGVKLNLEADILAPFEHDEALYAIGDEVVEYNAIIEYGVGPIKNNTLGEPDPTGQIAAGSVSTPVVRFNGQRKLFFGFDKSILDSANIRALQNDVLNPTKGMSFNINIPAGTVKVHFAYPASLGDVQSVLFKEGLNAEIRGSYTKAVVSVAGANSFTAINYNVYTFEPVSPFESNYTHIVKI
jgi:hypothetical protein